MALILLYEVLVKRGGGGGNRASQGWFVRFS